MAKAKKLPSGNWRVQVKKTIDGKVITKSFTDSDRRTAEHKAAQWAIECADESSGVKGLTLDKAYEKYISSKDTVLSPNTVRDYNRFRRISFQELMPLDIAKLTTAQIQSAVNVYAGSHAPKGTANAYSVLSSVLKMFRPDFSPKIKLPQKVKTKMYIPDDDDIKKLLKAIKGTEMEIAVLLAAFGPLRRAEICAVTSEDLHGNVLSVDKSVYYDKKSKEWKTKVTKNYSSNRNVSFPDFVVERLAGIDGKLYKNSPTTITNSFPRILEKNGIPKFRFHDLRHYSVSIQHALGIPDKYIMARGGWATSYTMNNVYNHTLKKNEDEKTRLILNHFSELNKEIATVE